jgi:transcriptional regulator with XRE-family HTH domain
MNIAKIIREGREKLNLNQSELAELLGVTPQAVQQWESGATQPRGKRLNKIAEVLKLPSILMHFGIAADMPEKKEIGKPPDSPPGDPPRTVAEKPVSPNDALINEVVKAMQRMSKEDAALLVTLSKALVREEPQTPATDVKKLPVPDLAPHPASAFPPRRVPRPAGKARGKTAIR